MKCPILKAIDVFRWIENGILPFEPLSPGSAILKMLNGKTVRRSWKYRTKAGNIKKYTRTQYLKKGVFLITITMPVPDWEMDLIKKQDKPIGQLGIFSYGNGFRRLCFMKVSSLDHAVRQTDHVLNGYIIDTEFKTENLPEIAAEIERAAKIVDVIGERRFNLTAFHLLIKKRMKSYQYRLRTFINNAPTYTGRGRASEAGKNAIARNIASLIANCLQLNFRPIYRESKLAVDSLTKAHDNLLRGNIALSRRHILSAINHLTYPEPEK